MTIQAVSFGKIAKTKKGNDYKKSHVGTVTGAITGTAFGTYCASKYLNSFAAKRNLVTTYNALKETVPKEKALKLVKRLVVPMGAGLGVAFWGMIGLGIGALANKAINHHKAAVVDKKVTQIENKLNGKK